MLILVTGKSGSGKSVFAKKLAKEIGYKYIDVDSIGHSLYDIPSVLQHAELLFGQAIYDESGNFDRKKLGQIVFQERDSERVKEFNDFTWNYMQKEIDKLLEENENIILDWILLPLTKYWEMLAYKILIKPKNDSIRYEKLLERDKVNIDYLKLRDKSSIVYNEKEFNYIIYNDYDDEKYNFYINYITNNLKNCIYFEALGTKSPFALKDSACPSYYIKIGRNKILLDCGSGSHRFFKINQLDNLNIFISHLHRDHYNDLYNYMYSAYALKNLGKVKEKINIFLPKSPTNIVDDIKSEKLTFSNIYTFDKTTKLNIDDIKIEFLEVDHSQDMECFAIKIKTVDKVIVYTGDISYSNKSILVDFAKGCDVLICEASLLKKHNFPEINNHITAWQAATIAKEAQVKKLLLTHFWAEEELGEYLKEAETKFDNTIALKERDKFYL